MLLPKKDVDIAVKAARTAFEGEWSKVTPGDRGRFLVKLADIFERDSKKLALVEALDNGKSIASALGDVQAAAEVFRYYGGWADKIHGKVIDTSTSNFNYTKQEAIGVCGQIIP